MDIFIKQATLSKLASLRLAVNYVLRSRYMAKLADDATTPSPASASPSPPTPPATPQPTPPVMANLQPRNLKSNFMRNMRGMARSAYNLAGQYAPLISAVPGMHFAGQALSYTNPAPGFSNLATNVRNNFKIQFQDEEALEEERQRPRVGFRGGSADRLYNRMLSNRAVAPQATPLSNPTVPTVQQPTVVTPIPSVVPQNGIEQVGDSSLGDFTEDPFIDLVD